MSANQALQCVSTNRDKNQIVLGGLLAFQPALFRSGPGIVVSGCLIPSIEFAVEVFGQVELLLGEGLVNHWRSR